MSNKRTFNLLFGVKEGWEGYTTYQRVMELGVYF